MVTYKGTSSSYASDKKYWWLKKEILLAHKSRNIHNLNQTMQNHNHNSVFVDKTYIHENNSKIYYLNEIRKILQVKRNMERFHKIKYVFD